MSILASLTTAALCAAVVAACLPDAGTRRTRGYLAVWPTAVAALLACIGMIEVLAAGGDLAGAALVLLVSVLTLVVQLFASRNLRGDPRSRGFFALSALAAAGSTIGFAADDVVLLAAGWTLATLSTIALIRTGGAGAQTRLATRRTAFALLIGDAALWAAVVVAVGTTGSTSITALSELRDASAVAVGALVAVTAIARAGSFPLHGWLPATAATTTPVSALLHAGFVNAGALLLLRFAAVPSVVGPWIVGVAGAVTMLAAAAAMLTRPDVKGRLVQSTAAQMGFMLMACALGAFGVALVHVVGHALFKASLFLGAGSAVERTIAARGVDRVAPSRVGGAAGAVVVIAAATVAGLVEDVLAHGSAVLLLFVVATAAVAAATIGAGRSTTPVRGAWITAIAAAVFGYVLLVFRGAEALTPPLVDAALPPVFAAAVFVGAVALALVVRTSGRVADRVFAIAFAWGRPPLPVPAPRPSVSRSSMTPTAASGPFEYGSL